LSSATGRVFSCVGLLQQQTRLPAGGRLTRSVGRRSVLTAGAADDDEAGRMLVCRERTAH